MASSRSRQVPNGDYFSTPASAQRSLNPATPPIYWDTKLHSELSLVSADSTVPSPTSPNPICLPPRAYSLPELYHSSIKIEEELDLHPYDSFMQWEDSVENSMDPSMAHFFPDLKLENTFSSAITGFETHTNPIPTSLQHTDTIMSGTIHDPASVFGEDPIAEGPLFETSTVPTPNNTQQRKTFYEHPPQQMPYQIPRANGPVTRGTAAAALKTDPSSPHDPRLRNIVVPPKSYAPPSPSSASSATPPPVTTRTSRRKRKSSDSEDDESPPDTKDYGRHHAPVKKTAHNMIEKRYRTNLNDKIAALRDCVPSLRVTSGVGTGNGAKKGKGDAAEDLQGLSPAHKLNKATVLSKAAEYIMHLEKRNKALCKENAAYKGRIEAFEILMLTTKNSNTTTTTTTNTKPISATSSNSSSRSGSGCFNSTASATSLSECGSNEAVDEDPAEETKMKMSEEEEVLKNELDIASAN